MKIFDYNTQPQFNLDWLVLKVNSSVAEDFSDATLKVWLMSNNNAYPLTIAVANGHITADISARFAPGKLPVGTYGFKAVWAKNERRPRNVFPHGDIICTERYEVFGISNVPSEVTETTTSEDEVTIKFSTHTASYGEDGLSAYELSVMKGLTTDDETTYLSGVELQSNKITAWGQPTNTQYPSAKLVKDTIDPIALDVAASEAAIVALQSGKEAVANKVNYIGNNVTHSQYPSALAVKVKLDTKADLQGGKVPASQLPSYVDDIVEFSTNVPQSRWRHINVVDHIVSAFPSEPIAGDIYFLTEDDGSWGYYAGVYLCNSGTGFDSLAVNSESLIIQKGMKSSVSADDNIGWFYDHDWYDLRQKTFADFFGTVTSAIGYIYFQYLCSNGTAVITKDGYNVNVTIPSSGRYNVSVVLNSGLEDLQSGKIYLHTNTNNTYRWSGSEMVKVTSMDLVTTTSDGLMKHEDKAKLDNYPTTPNYEAVVNKVTNFDNPTDAQYPSAKAVKDSLDLKMNISANRIFLSVATYIGIVNGNEPYSRLLQLYQKISDGYICYVKDTSPSFSNAYYQAVGFGGSGEQGFMIMHYNNMYGGDAYIDYARVVLNTTNETYSVKKSKLSINDEFNFCMLPFNQEDLEDGSSTQDKRDAVREAIRKYPKGLYFITRANYTVGNSLIHVSLDGRNIEDDNNWSVNITVDDDSQYQLFTVNKTSVTYVSNKHYVKVPWNGTNGQILKIVNNEPTWVNP